MKLLKENLMIILQAPIYIIKKMQTPFCTFSKPQSISELPVQLHSIHWPTYAAIKPLAGLPVQLQPNLCIICVNAIKPLAYLCKCSQMAGLPVQLQSNQRVSRFQTHLVMVALQTVCEDQ